MSPTSSGAVIGQSPRYLRMTPNTLPLVMFERLSNCLRWACNGNEAVYLWHGESIMLRPSAIGKRGTLPRALAVAALLVRKIQSWGKAAIISWPRNYFLATY